MGNQFTLDLPFMCITGNIGGAKSSSKAALGLNIAATVIGVIAIIVVVSLAATGYFTVYSRCSYYNNRYYC